jgi:diguanylate cyclase (GGDEF)-like protein
MYPLLVVGLVLLVRGRTRTLTTSIALDAAVSALAAASVAVTLLYPSLAALTAPGTPGRELAVDLAYPVLDVMLIVVVVGALALSGRRPAPAGWGLAVGVAGFAAVDAVFLYQAAAGTFRPGTVLSSGALALMALTAAAAWLPGEPAGDLRRRTVPDVVLPAVSSLVCLGVLVVAARTHVPFLGVAFAGAGMAAATARTVLSFRAVRELAEHRREARTDELTGLPNRRAFNEGLARALGHRPPDRRMALLVVDLDDFKAVNDSLGHHYGDELLRQVAPRLRRALRSGDVVARIGGDEFAVLLTDADGALAVSVAERIRAGFRRRFQLGARDLLIAASVGIALVPEDGREPVELLQHADLAMYEAKSTRRGRRSSAVNCTPRGASGWRRRSGCGAPSRTASWCCTTSRRWLCPAARSPVSRRSSGGSTPSWAWSHPAGSCTRRRAPV